VSLRDEIERNPIIDGHEHLLLPREAQGLRLHLPRLFWDCYVQYDFLSAGLSRGE